MPYRQSFSQQAHQQHQHQLRQPKNEKDKVRVGIDFGNTIADLWSNTSTSSTTTTDTTTTKTRIDNNYDADSSVSSSVPLSSSDVVNDDVIKGPTRSGFFFPYAIEMIRHMVLKFGSDNVFIVSKAGPKLQEQIKAFLNEQDFWKLCSSNDRHPHGDDDDDDESNDNENDDDKATTTKKLHKVKRTTMITAEKNLIFVRGYVDKAKVVQDLNINLFFDDHIKVVRCLAPLPCIQRIYWMNQYTTTTTTTDDHDDGNNTNKHDISTNKNKKMTIYDKNSNKMKKNGFYDKNDKNSNNKMYVVDRQYRHKLVIPKNWQSIMKFLQKI